MKNLLIAFLTLIMFSGCSVINIVRMKNANDDIAPVWQENQSIQLLEAIYIGDKPYVKAEINGGEELLFLLDSGASFSILQDTAKVKSLKLKRGFDLEIGGWGDDRNTLAYQTGVDKFSFGSVSFSNVKFAFFSLTETPYFARPDEALYDGVIGHDIMRHFAWTFNKRDNQISISASQYQPVSNDEVKLEFDTFLSKISIPVTISFDESHSVERDVTIDTGSRHYFKLSSAYLEGNKIKLDKPMVDAMDFGLSGRAAHKRFTSDQLTFGNITMNDVKTNVIKADDEDDYWVIGSALLSQYITTIDYHTSQFYILPYKNTEFKSRYNLAGLELRKLQNGNLLVRYVFPNLPAGKAGFKEGDEITRVGDKSVKDISEDRWLDISATPGDIEICNRNMCKILSIKHIAGYSS